MTCGAAGVSLGGSSSGPLRPQPTEPESGNERDGQRKANSRAIKDQSTLPSRSATAAADQIAAGEILSITGCQRVYARFAAV